MLRVNTLPIVLLALLAYRPALGQSVEESESEAIEAESTPNSPSQNADASKVAQLIVEQTNEFRIANNRSKVETNPKLTETAQYFASYMAENDTYGHNADGRRPSQRATKFGYDYCLISENIAYQFDSTGFATAELAGRFVEGWKNSPGHRENMLQQGVVETGVAVARSDDSGYWYAVQMFGRPKSAAVEFKIANRSNATVDYTIANRTFLLPPGYTRTHLRCQQVKVSFDFPAGEGAAETIEPSSGQRFTVARRGGQLDVQQQ